MTKIEARLAAAMRLWLGLYNKKLPTGSICVAIGKRTKTYDNKEHKLFYKIAAKWPKYSGCHPFPIKDRNSHASAKMQWVMCVSGEQAFHKGTQGELRAELAKFVLDYLGATP